MGSVQLPTRTTIIGKLAREIQIPGFGGSLLSYPSKMPGASFGLIAGQTCPGAVIGSGTICGSCYAARANSRIGNDRHSYGRYNSPNVRNCQTKRTNWTLIAVQSGEFVRVMTAAIDKATDTLQEPYFRIHDSGDFYSAAYVADWTAIVVNLPHVKFWAPTRSYRIPRILPALQTLASLPNITIRPSALRFGENAPTISGLSAGSGVSEVDYNCPSHEQNGKCADCRQCWDSRQTPIVYRLH